MQASPTRATSDIELQVHPDARPQGRLVTGWLLDTNVLSELRRPKPERKVLAFIVACSCSDLLHVSAATLR